MDTTAPSCTITEAACTSGALVLTLTWSEDIKTPSGWTKVNGTTYTKEVTSNDTVSVEVTDLVWNTWSCSITPSNYDNTAPSTSASGVPSDWTGSNVIVTLRAGSNGCNSSNTTYYCVANSGSTCTPNTQWTGVRKCMWESGNVL